jgi:gas vesicle protein
VKLAVVDWSRADSGGRTEDTGLTESLVHDQVRDRTLTESVHAVLDEWQRGGSIMGGAAASGGAGIAGGGLTGAGIGLTAALGGAYSTSSGTRDLAAQTTQKIADSFHQASTAMRELRSTVLVQSNEAEASKVQTRVVANYNHSHALTLLYYEVLRHYRVVTRLASVRPVVLISYQGLGKTFDKPDDVIPHRKLLESFLLDTRLMSCFDAAEKLLAFTKDTPPPTPDVGATKFVLFQLRFTTRITRAPAT